MSNPKPRLIFVSPIFLFPTDAGGKIRTTNVLRGLKGGRFEVTLLSPATRDQEGRYAREVGEVCDRFVPWRVTSKPKWLRAFDLVCRLPVNVAADRTRPAMAAVRAVRVDPARDVMVFDFVHAAVLRPPALECASVCFTHNVEAEIFARHAEQASGALLRSVWVAQHAKMLRFEQHALRLFTSVIAVSERDARFFRDSYGLLRVAVIPTGVDLEFFEWRPPPPIDDAHPETVVFTGSMDSAANIGGVRHFIESVWPRVIAQYPRARFIVVGRNPPKSLRALTEKVASVEFTGSVDDVRPFVRRSHVFVIPLLVGGGTRIKAFEAMAMGCPVVSTSVGIEGLDVEADAHYLRADGPGSMADAIGTLLATPTRRLEISRRARTLVERHFGHSAAARAFEQACLDALQAHARGSAACLACRSDLRMDAA